VRVEGQTLGHRVLHLYDPKTGVIIALGVNSSADSEIDSDKLVSPDNDTLDQLTYQVYRALTNR
jgi:hypothetical protein